MSEKDSILNSKVPITYNILINNLKNIGIEKGSKLLVHTSLSKIGWVCGSATIVIDALLDSVSKDGTIIMPAFCGENSNPALWQNPPVPTTWLEEIYNNMPAFDKDKTATRGVGQIPEVFRKYPNTLRSNHPTSSFCANGKEAFSITTNHPLTPQFGIDSPLGYLYKNAGMVLMLGVGFANCTSFHLAEALVKSEMHKQGTSMYVDGKRQWVWYDDFDYDDSIFETIGDEFIKTGVVRECKVGNANALLFSIKDAVDYASDYLKKGF